MTCAAFTALEACCRRLSYSASGRELQPKRLVAPPLAPATENFFDALKLT